MEVLDRASKAGIFRILNPGVDLESSRKAVMLAEENAQIFAAVGVHPNDGNSWNENSLSELRQLAGNIKVRAIGEIGLDYYRQNTEPVVQKRIFNTQLELAADLDMPVVIHIRDRENGDDSASNDALMMLEAHVQVLRKLEKSCCGKSRGAACFQRRSKQSRTSDSAGFLHWRWWTRDL